MGTFRKWYDAGAGVTLGQLVSERGFELGESAVNFAFDKAFVDYQANFFDPIVRNDLNDLLVFGCLREMAYPFPTNQKTGSFFKRHPHTTISLILIAVYLAVFFITVGTNPITSLDSLGIIPTLGTLIGLFIAYSIVSKIFRSGKKVVQYTYQNKLNSLGEQYWYVREFARQSILMKQMDAHSAMNKLITTSLAQLFPDTADEIAANEFFYRQRHQQ